MREMLLGILIVSVPIGLIWIIDRIKHGPMPRGGSVDVELRMIGKMIVSIPTDHEPK